MRPLSVPIATTEDAAELTEQVGEIDVLVHANPPRPGTADGARPVPAEAVVLLALLRVREQVVRALNLLEALLGRASP